jgi:protein involved in polysaccharide export with SLBB domain
MSLRGIAIVLVALIALQISASAANHPPTVKVMGELMRPGEYEMGKGAASLLHAVDAAGGVADDGDHTVVVSRKISAKLTQEIRFNSLSALKESPSADVDLQPNDVVVIEKPAKQ